MDGIGPNFTASEEFYRLLNCCKLFKVKVLKQGGHDNGDELIGKISTRDFSDFFTVLNLLNVEYSLYDRDHVGSHDQQSDHQSRIWEIIINGQSKYLKANYWQNFNGVNMRIHLVPEEFYIEIMVSGKHSYCIVIDDVRDALKIELALEKSGIEMTYEI
ncbi:hypothetical protein [Marinicellulosiphila megalodicopiae]|uniref:hypothetical protein n=1 Tax=Marinicellulosiphila megalodicopiae TaxID=2724896 RepID=UPI003BAEDCBF